MATQKTPTASTDNTTGTPEAAPSNGAPGAAGEANKLVAAAIPTNPGRPKRIREMVEVSNDLPPVWEPAEPGEMLAGYWDGTKPIKKGKNTFNTLRIKGEDGSLQSFSGVIPERTLVRMPIGTYVEIIFKGWVSASGGEARDYRILHEKGVTLLPEQDTAQH